jgi:hypothetical protein
MKRAVEEFKKQFTGGFVHSSGSNKITAFDPTKSTKPKELITPGITFASPMENAKWSADNFLPVTGPRSDIEGYKTGATMYPLSINMGKHFDASTPEGQEIAASYVRDKFLSGDEPDKKAAAKFLMGVSDPQYNWKTMESPEFIQHLKDTGHDSFSVNEMGVKNVGVFDPKNIRGKFAEFNPEEAMNPDFMKAAGGSIVKGAKKVLEHAKSMPVVHYSKQSSLTELDPRFYGSKEGIKGQEARRLKDAQDIRDRSYFYVDAGENTMKPEQGLGPFKYQGMAHDIYDLANDPAGYGALAKVKALDPYLASMGREMIDPEIHANELERAIKGAGYGGYSNDKVGLTWSPLPVTRSE